MKIRTVVTLEKEIHAEVRLLAKAECRSVADILREATAIYVKEQKKTAGFNKPMPSASLR